jgi:hypothetical protein
MCDDSEETIQQAVNKLFQKFFSIYFELRSALILINEYISLRILSVFESTEHNINAKGATFGNLPEKDGT